MPQSDSIRHSDLESLLKDTFLQSIHHFQETDSTNTRAIDVLATNDSILTPALVYAERQNAGRGRGDNQWWSTRGSLTFSVVVDFQEITISAEQKPLLPLLTGMAILRAGQQVLPAGEFALKWPNDVYLAGRKLAGVLIEVPSQSTRYAVIGIGLNVNNRFSDAPQELQSTGIAIADASSCEHDRLEVLRKLLICLGDLIKSFAANEDFLVDWPNYCLLTGKQVTLRTGSTRSTGVCQGIAPDGALVLKIDGSKKRFFGGVVESWS